MIIDNIKILINEADNYFQESADPFDLIVMTSEFLGTAAEIAGTVLDAILVKSIKSFIKTFKERNDSKKMIETTQTSLTGIKTVITKAVPEVKSKLNTDAALKWIDKFQLTLTQFKNSSTDQYYNAFDSIFNSSNTSNKMQQILKKLATTNPAIAHGIFILTPILIFGGTAIVGTKILKNIKNKHDIEIKFEESINKLNSAKTEKEIKFAEKEIAVLVSKYIALSEF